MDEAHNAPPFYAHTPNTQVFNNAGIPMYALAAGNNVLWAGLSNGLLWK